MLEIQVVAGRMRANDPYHPCVCKWERGLWATIKKKSRLPFSLIKFFSLKIQTKWSGKLSMNVHLILHQGKNGSITSWTLDIMKRKMQMNLFLLRYLSSLTNCFSELWEGLWMRHGVSVGLIDVARLKVYTLLDQLLSFYASSQSSVWEPAC